MRQALSLFASNSANAIPVTLTQRVVGRPQVIPTPAISAGSTICGPKSEMQTVRHAPFIAWTESQDAQQRQGQYAQALSRLALLSHLRPCSNPSIAAQNSMVQNTAWEGTEDVEDRKWNASQKCITLVGCWSRSIQEHQ